MKIQLEDQLRLEIAHIFDSGANETRILKMVKDFILKNYTERDTTPFEVLEAKIFIAACHADMGFMGSPEYDEKKKIVDNYYEPIKKKEMEQKERDLFLKLKQKYEG